MNISRYVSWPLFMVSFLVGLLYAFIAEPDVKSVYIYPTPDNYMKSLFQDHANQCFRMTPSEVPCSLEYETIPPQD